MKLILMPVSVLLLLAIFSLVGIGEQNNLQDQKFTTYDTVTSKGVDGEYLYLYNGNGEPVCYWNGTGLTPNDDGKLTSYYAGIMRWQNSTHTQVVYFDATQQRVVKTSDMTVTGFLGDYERIDENTDTFSLDTSLGWIILFTAILAIGTIAGIRLFGSGLSDSAQQLLYKGTFFITLWTMLSLLSYDLIMAGGFLVFIVYFIFTAMYVIGTVRELYGSGGSE